MLRSDLALKAGLKKRDERRHDALKQKEME